LFVCNLFVYLLHVNCLFQKGNTYLHFICTLYRPDCLFVCNLFVYLLHVNCLFQKGNTYLHFICTLYRPDCFHILSATRLNINAQNKVWIIICFTLEWGTISLSVWIHTFLYYQLYMFCFQFWYTQFHFNQ
jgi:hypothetical protein